jgi:hypothetical protein
MSTFPRAVLLVVVAVLAFGAGPAMSQTLMPWATQAVSDNSGASASEAEAITTLADGSAMATGLFKGTVDFGSTSLTSAGNNDIFVTRTDPSGAFLWAVRAGGTGNDGGYGVSALADGSAIVTGQFRGTATFGGITLTASGGSADIFVAKVDASGSFVWASRAGDTSTDKAWYVSTLGDGSAIVTGWFLGTATFGGTTLVSTGGSDDIFVAKIDASGSFVWATQAGGTTSNDEGIGVSTLADGSSIVTGTFEGPASFGAHTLAGTGAEDIFVAKVSPSGSFVWATQAGGTAEDEGFRASTLADGSAIVEGYFGGTATFGSTTLQSAGGEDFFVAKVSASGEFQWATRAGGTGDDGTESWGVSTLADGSAIVSGSFEGVADFGSTTLTSGGNADVFVAKVDSAGTFLWATRAGGTGDDYGWDVGTRADGSALVTGRFKATAVFGSTTLSTTGSTDMYLVEVVSPSATPTSVTATAGNGQATVSWAIPVYSGGTAITSYTATASPGGGTCTATAPATSCTINGLSNGTSYTFTVVATNAAGASPRSAPSNSATPAIPAAAAPTTTTLRPTVLPSRTRLVSGQAVRIGLRVVNTGAATAPSVRSCLKLPANLVVTSTAGAQRSGRTLCFSLGDLPAGATRTKVVTARAVATRAVSRTVTGTARTSATTPAITATRSSAIQIRPRAARAAVTG